MTTSELIAVVALFAAFIAACLRARWVALAIAPPVLLTLAVIAGLVDISSASHPLRIATALLGLSLSMWAAWCGKLEHIDEMATYEASVEAFQKVFGEQIKGPNQRMLWDETIGDPPFPRTLVASILVFASYCVDIPALFTWQIPGIWVLIPIQIAVCVAVIFVLLAPERWLSK